nr:unnamed protein product [Digitaria exilis]
MESAVVASFLLLLCCQAAAAAAAGAISSHRRPPPLTRHYASPLVRRRHVTSPGTAAATVPAMVQYETRYYTQRLDHFNALPASYGTFQQRYLINDTFWAGKTSPIFLYAGNEGDIDLFTNNTGFMWESAPRFGAMLVFVEHRYYGESMPFGSKEKATKGYLSVTQALADFTSFVLSLKSNLSAPAAPVVVFGGSYGGMLAVWMRLKYPHIVMGAVASSAPIRSFYHLTDPYAFYDRVTDDFKSESNNCYDVLRGSWAELDGLLATKNGSALLRRSFNMCNGSSVRDIPSLLESAMVNAAMTDYPTPSGFLAPLPGYPVREMCRAVDHPSSGNDTLAKVRDAMNVYYNSTGASPCLGGEEDGDPYGMYDGWNWQACTEMVLMTYGLSNRSIIQPPWPFNFTDDIGNVLKGSASNIIFFNGLRDPWSTGGVLKSISKSIIALVEPKGAHHVDLRFSSKEDPEWLKKVRAKETRIIARWLKQYYKDEAVSGPVWIPPN